MIEVNNLTKYFGDLCAVDHVGLHVENEVFGLLGPNGAGKSTIVRILATLQRPTEGTARICGYGVVREPKKARSVISYVPQEMALDIKHTGRENVLLYAKLYGIPNRARKVNEVLDVMELSERAGDLVRTHSRGMRRRLELAQALVHEPEVLFLDEPALGLDVADGGFGKSCQPRDRQRESTYEWGQYRGQGDPDAWSRCCDRTRDMYLCVRGSNVVTS